MVDLASLWLPILLSSVFVFVASSVIHMALQLHKGDYKKLPNEDSALDALRRAGVPPGQYMFPFCPSMKEMGSPEMQAKLKQGPLGTIIVRDSKSMNMGTALGQWFAFCVAISVCCAYVAGMALGPGDGLVFRMTATVALVGYGLSGIVESIWKGVAWSTSWKFLFDGLVYALATGATFAWLWPAAA
jgi:hypothetical protein